MMLNKTPNKEKSVADPASTSNKEPGGNGDNTQVQTPGIAQDIRQNSGNNDSTNEMIGGEKNNHR